MKPPPSRAHQTMLLLFADLIPRAPTHPAGSAFKAASRFSFRVLGCRRWCEASRYPNGKCHIIGSRTKSRDFGGIAQFMEAELITRKA
jgi:hypothetical protein